MMTSPDGTNTIDVAIVPHPFAAERIRHAVRAGGSVTDIIGGLQPDAELVRYAHVYLNGNYIPRAQWLCTYPEPGDILSIRMVPLGGAGGGSGGKNPLRTVLSLAMTMAIPELLPAGASLLGINLSAGTSLLTRLALNALAPPPAPRLGGGNKESPTLFIQGARNRAAQFSRVPKVLGTHRFVPPLGAQPYTETVGGDQYLRMLFIWGYGPLEISSLQIGETPLSDFADVQVETRQGYPGDAPLTLYTNSIIQNDLQISLTNAAGYALRTTDTDADEISVDITFPNGLVKYDAVNNKTIASAQFTVDYAPAGSGVWTSAGTINVSAMQSAALRRGTRFAVTRGQYDVRLRRVTADSADASVFDVAVWTALRTIRYTQPVAMPGLAMTALRIKATNQLSGVIDQFNGVVSSILPDWDGSAWTARVTSNPASIFRHVLQGSANARPLDDSRLDLGKMQAWHANCAAAGREFNAVIDYDVSVRQVLQDVAATGRASPSFIDGKWAAVEDAPQAVPVQHFTPRNTFNFRGEKIFAENPDALRVRFINRDSGWLQDERLVYDDGYDAVTARKYEVLELPGVTSSAQAWKDGRYHIATARLRPETYSFYADAEHIVCTRGDLIRFTHDVPMFGLMSARVKALSTDGGGNITAVTLDADVPMTAGQSYAVRFRLADGSSLVLPVVANAGAGATLALTAPCPASGGPGAGDLALFGESGQESVELVVRAIEPQNDLNARIICVDAAPAIFSADTSALPAFSSQISLPPQMKPPPAPSLGQIQSGLESMIRHADGSFTSRIVITLQPPVYNAPLDILAQIRAQGETDFRAADVMLQAANSISIVDIADGGIYDLQIRYAANDGTLSPPLLIPAYQVVGTTALPSDVTNFNMNVRDSTAYLSWTAVPDIDLSHYMLRYAPQTSGVNWGSATDLIPRIPAGATSISVPAAIGTYLIKAVSIRGLLSANGDIVVSTVAGLAGYNAVLNIAEDPGFAGAGSFVGVSGTSLRLSGADTVDSWGDLDTVANADLGNSGLASGGTYGFGQSADLGAVYTSRLTASLNAVGVDINSMMDVWNNIDVHESWDQTIDPSLWNVQLQLRTTNDDPAVSPAWSSWEPFVVGDYSARAYQFRALLTGRSPTVTPAISRLQVNIDMPDRTVGDRNIAAAPGGSAISFASPFRAIPAISITAQNLATGDYYAVTGQSASGFTIRFFNAGGSGVSRTFDYLAKGYGQQV